MPPLSLDELQELISRQRKNPRDPQDISAKFLESSTEKSNWKNAVKTKMFFDYFFGVYIDFLKKGSPPPIINLLNVLARVLQNQECFKQMSSNKEFFTYIDIAVKMTANPTVCLNALIVVNATLDCSKTFPEREKMLKKTWASFERVSESVINVIETYYSAASTGVGISDTELKDKVQAVEEALNIFKKLTDVPRCLKFAPFSLIKKVFDHLPLIKIFRIASAMNQNLASISCSFLSRVLSFTAYSRVKEFRKNVCNEHPTIILDILSISLFSEKHSHILDRREAARQLIPMIFGGDENVKFLFRIYPAPLLEFLRVGRDMVVEDAPSFKKAEDRATLMNEFRLWSKRDGAHLLESSLLFSKESHFNWDAFWNALDRKYNRARVIWNEKMRQTLFKQIQNEITYAKRFKGYEFNDFPFLSGQTIPQPCVGLMGIELLAEELDVWGEHHSNIKDAREAIKERGLLPHPTHHLKKKPFFHPTIQGALTEIATAVLSHVDYADFALDLLLKAVEFYPEEFVQSPLIPSLLASISHEGEKGLHTAILIIDELISIGHGKNSPFPKKYADKFLRHLIKIGLEDIMKRALRLDASTCSICFRLVNRIIVSQRRGAFRFIQPEFYNCLTCAAALFNESDEFEEIVPSLLSLTLNLLKSNMFAGDYLFSFGVFELALAYLVRPGANKKMVASFVQPFFTTQRSRTMEGTYLDKFIPLPIVRFLIANDVEKFLMCIEEKDLLTPEIIWNEEMNDKVIAVVQHTISDWVSMQKEKGEPLSFIRFAAEIGKVVTHDASDAVDDDDSVESPQVSPEEIPTSPKSARLTETYHIPFIEKKDEKLTAFVLAPPVFPDPLDAAHIFVGDVYLNIFVKMPETCLKKPGVFLKAITDEISAEHKMWIDAVMLLFKHHGGKQKEVDNFFGTKKLRAVASECDTDTFESVVLASSSVIGATQYSDDDFGMDPHLGNLTRLVEERVLNAVFGRCMGGEDWALFDKLFNIVANNVIFFISRGENRFSDAFVEQCFQISHAILANVSPVVPERRHVALSLINALTKTLHGATCTITLRTIVFALEGLVFPENFFSGDASEEEDMTLRVLAAEILLMVANVTQDGPNLLAQVFPMSILRTFDSENPLEFVKFLRGDEVIELHTVWDPEMYEEMCASVKTFVERIQNRSVEVLDESMFLAADAPDLPSFQSTLPSIKVDYTRFKWEVIIHGTVIRGFLDAPNDAKLNETKDVTWAEKMLENVLTQVDDDEGRPIGDNKAFDAPPEGIPLARHIIARGLATLIEMSVHAATALPTFENFNRLLLFVGNNDLVFVREITKIMNSLSVRRIPELDKQLFMPCWVVLSNVNERFETNTLAEPDLEMFLVSDILRTSQMFFHPSKGADGVLRMLDKGLTPLAIALFLNVVKHCTPPKGTKKNSTFWPLLDILYCHIAQLLCAIEKSSSQTEADTLCSLVAALVCKQFSAQVREVAKKERFEHILVTPGTDPLPSVDAACETFRKLMLTEYKFEPIHFWSSEILDENLEFTSSLIGTLRERIFGELKEGCLLSPYDPKFIDVAWRRASEVYRSKTLSEELLVDPGVFPRAYLSHPHQKGFDRAQFFTGLCKYLQRITTSISQSLVDSDTPDKVAKDIADIVIIIQALEQLLNFSPDMLKNPLITKVLGNLLQFTAIIFSITHPAALEFAKTVETSALRFPALSNPLAFEPSALEPVRKNSIALINRFLSNPLVLRSLKRDEMLLDLHTILLCAPKENCRQVVRIVKDAILKGTEDGILLPAAATSLPLGLICSAISFEDNEARENAIEALVPFLFYCEESGAALRSCLPEEFLEVIEQTAASVIEFIDDMEFGLRKHIVKVFNERCFMHALGVVPTDPRSVTWDDLRPGAAFDGSEDEHSD